MTNSLDDLLEPVIINEIKAFVEDDHLYPPEYDGHFDGLMITSSDIQKRVTDIASLIHAEFQGKRPVLLCTLKGACPFFTHLCDALKEFKQGFDMEFVRTSSYDGISTTGNVQLVGELKAESIKGRHVIIVEDIVDTGTTLHRLIPILLQQGGPASIEICTLLDKRLENHAKKVSAKYVGFSIPDKFIIGYGLDYNELYRDLKDIFVISKKGIDFDGRLLR